MTELETMQDPLTATARTLVAALTANDFAGVAAAFAPDATMATLLPRGFVEWHGASEICGAFEQWFGDVDEYEVADAAVGRAGTLLHLRWRVRVRGPRFGTDRMFAEQTAYASTGTDARIDRMRLLCSGFWSDQPG